MNNRDLASELVRIAGVLSGLVKSSAVSLSPGQKVKILGGPAEGFTGKLLSIDGEKAQVEILVFGRKTPISVDVKDLKPISDADIKSQKRLESDRRAQEKAENRRRETKLRSHWTSGNWEIETFDSLADLVLGENSRVTKLNDIGRVLVELFGYNHSDWREKSSVRTVRDPDHGVFDVIVHKDEDFGTSFSEVKHNGKLCGKAELENLLKLDYQDIISDYEGEVDYGHYEDFDGPDKPYTLG